MLSLTCTLLLTAEEKNFSSTILEKDTRFRTKLNVATP